MSRSRLWGLQNCVRSGGAGGEPLFTPSSSALVSAETINSEIMTDASLIIHTRIGHQQFSESGDQSILCALTGANANPLQIWIPVFAVVWVVVGVVGFLAYIAASYWRLVEKGRYSGPVSGQRLPGRECKLSLRAGHHQAEDSPTLQAGRAGHVTCDRP